MATITPKSHKHEWARRIESGEGWTPSGRDLVVEYCSTCPAVAGPVATVPAVAR